MGVKAEYLCHGMGEGCCAVRARYWALRVALSGLMSGAPDRVWGVTGIAATRDEVAGGLGLVAAKKEQRRAALEKLATEVNELVLAVGCTASATVDVIRRTKDVAIEVQSALVRARRR